MKLRITFLFASLFLGFQTILSGQITEAEKKLRDQKADSTMGWKEGGILAVNLAQTSLTNWVAGGQNSFATNGLVSLFANFTGEKSSWINTLDIGYGIIDQKNIGTRKTDDKFDFLSKYGMKAWDHVYVAALVNFRTQLAEGYKYPNANNEGKIRISDFLAPAYVIGAVGLDYKPDNYFSAFIAPLTYKITIVNDRFLADQGAFGVDPGEKVNSEFGAYLRIIYTKTDFKNEFLKNVAFTSKVDLFSNYLKNPENIVVNWETIIALKVNRFISANINTQLIYDDKIKVPFDRNDNGIIETGESIGSKIQFKEILGVGLSYKF
jgi:hypothetical protein